MSQRPSEPHSPGQWLLAFWFAHWHLARLPRDTDRLARAAWCRDHCGTFAARWFILALVLILIQTSPLGTLFVIGGTPMLILLFLPAFLIAIAHVAWQIISQRRAGPPRIDPPQEWDDQDDDRRF
ncbi:hypothetical protein [Alkalilimnicola ehrlichii]|uniref:hypothetical protein n=1 Tax=Alkalilimnicola ehrlichii TaxID=351052 RepID=UPI003BA0C3F5